MTLKGSVFDNLSTAILPIALDHALTSSDKAITSDMLAIHNALQQKAIIRFLRDLQESHDRRQEIGRDLSTYGYTVDFVLGDQSLHFLEGW